MTSSPDQRLSPFQTQQLHAVEMQPGRHKQVSCGPPAFSPSYQGFHMRVVLHRPEAFVSSCRTSLSSRVTCVGYRTHLNVPDREICGYAAGLLHAPTKQIVLDGQISMEAGHICDRSWERMFVPPLVFPRSGTYCFNQISQSLKRNSSQ